MSARPPPARPHIALNPSSRFGSYSISDSWGEDDAWDSGSDEESSSTPGWKQPGGRPGAASTAPKPVPKPKSNRSSSTIASSYTHIDAPSSYPPRGEDMQPPAKQGWTIVRTAGQRASLDRHDSGGLRSEAHADPEVEGDLILGDMDSEDMPIEQPAGAHTKAKHGQGTVREDIDEIVKGTLLCMPLRARPPLITI